MDEHEWLAEQFEANRTHLQAVAYRMLGSLSEADDAVQESWLHLSRSDTSDVKNLGGWLTTVVARICLDMLREESLEVSVPGPITSREGGIDPEQEALLADSVGLALLVVLDTLSPAERLAFVLHDIFAVPFDEIAPMVERSETAARQLASRARRRVRGVATVPDADLTSQRKVVDAFLAASRGGDFDALLAVLDPDVVFRHDLTAVPADASREVRGARAVAKQFSGRAKAARPALVNGAVGIVVARQGRLFLVLNLTVTRGKIAEQTSRLPLGSAGGEFRADQVLRDEALARMSARFVSRTSDCRHASSAVRIAEARGSGGATLSTRGRPFSTSRWHSGFIYSWISGIFISHLGLSLLQKERYVRD